MTIYTAEFQRILDTLLYRQPKNETPAEMRERCIKDGAENLQKFRPILEAIKRGDQEPFCYVVGKGIVSLKSGVGK